MIHLSGPLGRHSLARRRQRAVEKGSKGTAMGANIENGKELDIIDLLNVFLGNFSNYLRHSAQPENPSLYVNVLKS